MRCVTWSRDSHGLFDYESRYISKKNIKTGQSGRIVRLNNDVEFIGMDMRPEDLDSSAKPLISITQNARGTYDSLSLLCTLKFFILGSISESSSLLYFRQICYNKRLGELHGEL